MRKFARFLHKAAETDMKPRQRLRLADNERVLYAIGDVHGCLDALLTLEEKIVEDAEKMTCEKLIIMLGDYIDRGPSSSEVITHLLGDPPEGFERICLLGNHEAAMLDFLDGAIDLAAWESIGAEATLASYGIEIDARGRARRERHVRDVIPDAHIAFMRGLPILVETERLVCVHAGLVPGRSIERQTDHDLIWSRPQGNDFAHQKWVVHGHTPVDSVKREGRRINVDTGAFYSGRLSALRVWNSKARILSNIT